MKYIIFSIVVLLMFTYVFGFFKNNYRNPKSIDPRFGRGASA